MNDAGLPPEQPRDNECASCGVDLDVNDQRRGVCDRCDRRLEGQLALWLQYSDAARALAQTTPS